MVCRAAETTGSRLAEEQDSEQAYEEAPVKAVREKIRKGINAGENILRNKWGVALSNLIR